MAQTTARIKKGSTHYEILVDLEEAMKVKNDSPGANLSAAVLTDAIFHNLKSGEHAGSGELENDFGTSDPMAVAEKIIKTGEVVKTAESMRAEHDAKYKQVVDFLSKNAVSPEGRPYTPDRIMKALGEAHVNVKNKPIESQVGEIMDELSKILPLKMETKKVRLHIQAHHSGKAYPIVKEFMKEEVWKNNGDLEVVVEMPTALTFDFYDRINSATHGSVLSEEIKK
jgi:ribosome maturation protein SDO1